MPKKKNQLEQFADLSWEDLNQWAGNKIVTRGRTYQHQGRVSGLAVTNDDALIAWVDGSEQYAVKVTMDESGMPDSVCTCPYQFDCKHAVAVVLEYMERCEKNQKIPKAKQNDERLELLEDADAWDEDHEDDEDGLPEAMEKEIETFLQQKTKKELIELFMEMAGQYPEISGELSDRCHLKAGNTAALVSKIRKEIDEISSEPGWQNHWDGQGFTPDYSGIRKKMEALLAAGCADEVLSLGEELMTAGDQQVEQSDDEGETADEISACMPVIVKALEQSSWKHVDKMAWAVDAVMEDNYDLFEPLAQYLHSEHPKKDWDELADHLLENLKSLEQPKRNDGYGTDYYRDQLTNWIIVALEGSGRTDEIIPLCEAEATLTHSYDRLVKLLMAENRFEDAERWIHQGIKALGKNLPGISSELRGKLLEIRTRQKNWPAVAAVRVDEFVCQPSVHNYTECQHAAEKVKMWPKVRECLLAYLEAGALPWKQNEWPLPESGLSLDDTHRRNFPIFDELIHIAIYEKKPEEVLRWYDQRPRQSYGWYGFGEDDIAVAVCGHAPDRAVAIWKKMVDNLIAQVKPSAYESAANLLYKIQKVLLKREKNMEWERYLKELKEKHIRKRRLIEILEGFERKPIIKMEPKKRFIIERTKNQL